MSKQMPMTEALNESISFGLNRFWTIVRCLLLPYLIMIFGVAVIMLSLIDFQAIAGLENADIEETPAAIFGLLGSLFRVSLPALIGIMIIAAMVLSLPLMGGMTSIYRLVGLGEEPGGWFHLRFDGPMWRMVIATIIFTLIQYVLQTIGYGIAIAMNPDFMFGIGEVIKVVQNFDFETGTAGYEPEIDFIASSFGTLFLGGLIGLVLSILVLTKLAPFVAASACENRLMLFSSWHMTKGNFWTILGGYILLVLAFVVLNLLYGIVSSLVQMVLTLVSFGLLAIPLAIVDFGCQLALGLFTIGVTCAWGSVLYRRLWVERGALDGNGGETIDV